MAPAATAVARAFVAMHQRLAPSLSRDAGYRKRLFDHCRLRSYLVIVRCTIHGCAVETRPKRQEESAMKANNVPVNQTTSDIAIDLMAQGAPISRYAPGLSRDTQRALATSGLCAGLVSSAPLCRGTAAGSRRRWRVRSAGPGRRGGAVATFGGARVEGSAESSLGTSARRSVAGAPPSAGATPGCASVRPRIRAPRLPATDLRA